MNPQAVKPAFLTAEWRKLIMINFAIDPAALRRHLPQGTELDTWGGTTYISLVAFSFLSTKIKGIAIPFHRDFEEINLRFYVRARGPEGWRRGVVFVCEVVPRAAIAFVAQRFYNENYIACSTRSLLVEPTAERSGHVEYGWKHRGEWLTIEADYSGAASLPAVDSQEEFITEHYWGYSGQQDGSTVEYGVEHPQWQVWAATESKVEGDVIGFYGQEFAEALTSRPTSAFIADGSAVTVRNGSRIGS